jgi:membrane protein
MSVWLLIRDFSAHADAFFQRGPVRRTLRSIYLGMLDHHAIEHANAMAFALFLASIPMIALGGWIFASVLKSDPRAIGAMSSLLDLAPGQVQEVLDEHVERFSGAAVAPMVLIGSLWLGSSAFHTVVNVFETALQGRPRPWWVTRLIALGCLVCSFVAAALSGIIAVVVAGGPLDLMGQLAGGRAGLAKAATLSVAAATTTLLVAGLFRVAVHRPGVRRRVWPGACVTVVLGTLASWGFTYWVGRLARYAVFYGSLAAVAIFLVWLWLCCIALLLGAEVNTQLEGVERVRPR